MRLANGSVAQEGRVEICMSGVWSGVCSDAWDRSDALVVCAQLGLGIAEPIITTDSSAYGEVFGPIIYSNISCNGYESMFSACYKNTYPAIQCTRNQVAGVFCRDGMSIFIPIIYLFIYILISLVCTEGSVMLTGGTLPSEGTVLICKNNVWGLVGQIGWDSNDANVICRQLQYTNGKLTYIHTIL